MSEQKHYGHFDDSIMDDGWHTIHVNAMTAEKLHSKAAIAAELAYRDRRIAALEQVSESAEIWARRGDSNTRHERDILEAALREAGYLGDGNDKAN